MESPVNWSGDSAVLLANDRLEPANRALYARALEQVNPPSPLIWLATSGSSGCPKLVGLSREALLASAASVNLHLAASAADQWGLAIPSFHVGGLSIFARAHLLTIPVHNLLPWNPLALATDRRITLTSLVPTQVNDLVAAGLRPPPQLRAVVVGGARLNPQLYAQAVALGWPLLPSFGSTEAGSQIATAELSARLSPEPPPLKIVSGWQARVDAGDRLSLRGPALAEAVIEISATPSLIRLARDGWWRSDDRVALAGDTLIPLGRVGEFAKVGGELVSLVQLRQRWESVGGRGVLLALPDSRLGESLHLVSEGENEREAMERYHAESLPFERIRQVHYLPIPRSALGKPLWAVLTQQLLMS